LNCQQHGAACTSRVAVLTDDKTSCRLLAGDDAGDVACVDAEDSADLVAADDGEMLDHSVLTVDVAEALLRGDAQAALDWSAYASHRHLEAETKRLKDLATKDLF
jgi:hypothetical protein